MELIWHGTASLEMSCPKGRILFDPFFPLDGSSVAIRPDEFDNFPVIFVTHGHLDHISSIPEIIKRNPDTAVYCTRTPYGTLSKKGVPESSLRLIDFGQSLDVCGFSIRTYHGKHAVRPRATPKRLASALMSRSRGNVPFIISENGRCRENGETVFYQIECGGKSVSVTGSMNLRDDVSYPEHTDLLVLPYSGWVDNLTHAVSVIGRLKPERVALYHYDDTFPPASSDMDLSPVLDRYGDRIFPFRLREPVTL